MPTVNRFAQMPATPEPIIAQVRRELATDCADLPCSPRADLDRLAEAAVRELWDGRVRVFVPILALRQAREALGVQGSGARTRQPVTDDVPAVPQPPRPRRPQRDVLRIDNFKDVLHLDERDVLTMRDDIPL